MKQAIYAAQVKQVERLGHDVDRVFLQLDQPVAFAAGQYLEIEVTQGNWAPFSIACAPGSNQLELHIQYLPGREKSEKLFVQLRPGNLLNLRLPAGDCFLQGTDRPMVLVAAGTGFAQIKAIVEAMWQQNWQSPVTFYWASKSRSGLYDLELAESWVKQHNNFHLIPLIELADAQWTGRTGRITEALATDYTAADSAREVQGYISGSPAMVYAVEDLLISRGMLPGALRSDVHAYAPRNL
jgi:CDP-4-dehydro-6-deoxyglucose reductase